jgi:phage baseplate assembly protein W
MAAPPRYLRFPIAVDRFRGRFAEEADYAAHVDQLVRQVLLTNPGERAHRPDFGCGIRRMVFSPNTEAGAQLLQVSVTQALNQWLSSVIQVSQVDVSANDATLTVGVSYVLIAHGERRYLNLEVSF